MGQLSLACPPMGDQACNPGKCLNLELNWRPFALWDDAPDPLRHTRQGSPDFHGDEKTQ